MSYADWWWGPLPLVQKGQPPHNGCSECSRCWCKKVNSHSVLSKYGWWGLLPLVQKRSTHAVGMQWTQYAADAVCSGCSTQWNSGIWWWGHFLWCKKVKPVDAVDAVDAVRSGIVVYGGGDIFFGAKRSSQWTQCMQYAVCSTQWMQWNSGIWWWGHCLWCKKVKPVDAMDAVCSGHSGIVVYGGGHIVFGAKRSNQWIQ